MLPSPDLLVINMFCKANAAIHKLVILMFQTKPRSRVDHVVSYSSYTKFINKLSGFNDEMQVGWMVMAGEADTYHPFPSSYECILPLFEYGNS